jgi:pimeloyl-ACP methyl ester carboxylesterase
MMTFLRRVVGVAIVPVGLYIFFKLVNGTAFGQESDTVVIREPGKRLLGPPHPVAPKAREDVDFAFLSQAAYHAFERKQERPASRTDDTMNAESTLRGMGWSIWDFPEDTLQAKFKPFNLRVEVWSNPSRNAVAVAFGGTVFKNLRDWQANLRWFLPHRDDEYTEVVEVLGNAFVEQYLEQSRIHEFLTQATLFATGHSLGGGLAQDFAYSLPVAKGVPRVKKVFAFDPSPVTGFARVGAAIRDQNKKHLEIDRIYERGEILALLRSITSFVHVPSAESPAVRQIRYNLFSRQPIISHSIPKLAKKLYEASG